MCLCVCACACACVRAPYLSYPPSEGCQPWEEKWIISCIRKTVQKFPDKLQVLQFIMEIKNFHEITVHESKLAAKSKNNVILAFVLLEIIFPTCWNEKMNYQILAISVFVVR